MFDINGDIEAFLSLIEILERLTKSESYQVKNKSTAVLIKILDLLDKAISKEEKEGA
jgi:hypothetical protein